MFRETINMLVCPCSPPYRRLDIDCCAIPTTMQHDDMVNWRDRQQLTAMRTKEKNKDKIKLQAGFK